MLLLECVPKDLGKRVSKALDIPVIGIGASGYRRQILVWHDLLWLYPGKPAKFVKNYLVGKSNGIQAVLEAYVNEVKDQCFPAKEHCYH